MELGLRQNNLIIEFFERFVMCIFLFFIQRGKLRNGEQIFSKYSFNHAVCHQKEEIIRISFTCKE